uniref:DNA polymerase, beta-like region n=1 Tax=uncultured bacterium contig00009 TaxID=1181501 RepID=A0A806KLU2_9BACT|nr:DNA polymerase, beta-like region [uncultured bacterium contig00009]
MIGANMIKDLPVMEQIVSLVTSLVTPEKIILFGSYARKENRQTSDIDIMILVKNLQNERAVTGKLYKALLKSDISIPVDFLAADYDRYNSLKNKPGYIYKTIASEGYVLYG